jgi:hypoxanthine phosphoribosyltransferase
MAIDAKTAQAVYDQADLIHSEQDVEASLDRIASEITEKLAESDPIVICIMNGGIIAAGKLLTKLNFPLRVDYLHATRYHGQTAAGELNWLKRNHQELKDQNIIIIDDILDEGITLQAIVEFCHEMEAASVHTAVVVEKIHDRSNGFKADFVGLLVEDRYVFGYGMDYKGYLRNAPGIFAVSEEHQGA